MKSNVTLEDRNKIAVMLMQALWGAISPNFRMVAFCPCEPVWKLLFVLEKEDDVDREEISDVAAEFDALQESGSARFEVEAVVSAAPLTWPEPPWLVVYRRRES